jgi:hypothetical protein
MTIAAFVAGFLRSGVAILAFPLLAWSPFLLLISLHMGFHAIRPNHDSGAPILEEVKPAVAAFGITIDLIIFAAFVAIQLHSGTGNLSFGLLPSSPILLLVSLDLASHIFALARYSWTPIFRRAIPAASAFCIAISLAVFALWMLFSMHKASLP